MNWEIVLYWFPYAVFLVAGCVSLFLVAPVRQRGWGPQLAYVTSFLPFIAILVAATFMHGLLKPLLMTYMVVQMMTLLYMYRHPRALS